MKFSATSEAGTPTRIRVLQPGGHSRNGVFNLHGHTWQELPYVGASTRLGNNPLSEWKGAQFGHGPSNHFDVLLRNGAGGKFRIPGDYLFRDMTSFHFDGGLWGLLRVKAPATTTTTTTTTTSGTTSGTATPTSSMPTAMQ
ncbi:MAG TPA: hypothetical protein VF746_32400 [Longimicrobium sp.]|jgi:hypothetical protein